jgi:SAM-dependent methyltransferase
VAHGPRTPPDGQRRAIDRAARREARLVAAALRAGRAPDDDAFDRFLPPELRDVSALYWTPLRVVRRAATWLREIEAPTVVDIGSGAGKFCVAAALLSRSRFVGLEKRAPLVDAARELAEMFGVDDRVTFVHGDLAATAAPAGDAYYFFNPFGEHAFYSRRFATPSVTVTPETYSRDVAAATALLSRAPVSTFVVTYNGFGGQVPPGYDQIDVATRLPGTLRLWKKEGPIALVAPRLRIEGQS